MAPRLFNITLPFGRLEHAKKKGDELSQTKGTFFLAIPVITLTAKQKTDPESSYFRNTLSMSIILIPVNETFDEKQDTSAKEMYQINDRTNFKLADSPLKDFLGSEGLEIVSPKNLLERLCKKTVEIAQANLKCENRICNQLAKSTYFTHSVLAHALSNDQVEDFYRYIGNETIKPQQSNDQTTFQEGKHGTINLHDELRSIITPSGFYKKYPDVIDFRKMVITNKARLGSSGSISFFNKGDSKILNLTYNKDENFPKFSFKWGFAYLLYMSISISVLEVMIQSFYRELESTEKHKPELLMELETKLISDIDEFYDLDIRSPYYKEEYENLRNVDGINRDFQMLKDKLNALKTNVVLEEQIKLTKEQAKVDQSILRLTEISIIIALAAMIIAAVPESLKTIFAIVSGVVVTLSLFYIFKNTFKNHLKKIP